MAAKKKALPTIDDWRAALRPGIEAQAKRWECNIELAEAVVSVQVAMKAIQERVYKGVPEEALHDELIKYAKLYSRLMTTKGINVVV